jgi:hypothetical protein
MTLPWYRPLLTPAPQAPSEAETEMAQLSAMRVIDIIVTTDTDALIFGAKNLMILYVILSVFCLPLFTRHLAARTRRKTTIRWHSTHPRIFS